MNYFNDYLNSVTPISETSLKELSKIVTIKKYPSKTQVCKIGDYPEYVYLLKEGIIRGYVNTHKGTEFNREIFCATEFVSTLSALIIDVNSELGLQCLSDCVVYKADYKKFMKLTKIYPDLRNLYVVALEDNFIKLEQRTIQLSTMTATERYLKLRKRIPNIDNLISQYHIASHLGITPIQMSRIRRELSLTT